MSEINFKTSTLYRMDIEALRTALRGNRTGTLTLNVRNQSALTPPVLELMMERRSLYITGFRAPGGTWRSFSDHSITGAAPLPYNGSHTTLGTDKGSTQFSAGTPSNLEALAKYKEGNADHLRATLSFLVVSVSEAIRFPSIQNQIERVLNGNVYSPQADCDTLMKNWADLTGRNDARVSIPYMS